MAEALGVRVAVLAACATVGLAIVLGFVLPVQDLSEIKREPAAYWGDPDLELEPDPSAPVSVMVEFHIAPDVQADFLKAMDRLRGSRLRTGATRWELLRDPAEPTRFVEIFTVPSWREHLLQHAGRLTTTDQETERVALGFSDPTPRSWHLVPPESLDERP